MSVSYRNDLDALEARHAALAHEARDAARRRDEAQALLDEAHAKRRPPALVNIRLASPCDESWADMPGDERMRACGRCQQNVYNLSGMTCEEAEALIHARNGGRLCVRYYQRPDGALLLADCEPGRNRRKKLRLLVGGIAALVVASISGYVACGPDAEQACPPDESVSADDPPTGGPPDAVFVDDACAEASTDPVEQARCDAILEARSAGTLCNCADTHEIPNTPSWLLSRDSPDPPGTAPRIPMRL
jgi:hypothetical protein